MLIVDTYLSVVEGKGVGLFAKDYIPKDSAYWIRNIAFDKSIPWMELDTYPHRAKAFVCNYGFQEPSGNWYLCIDNARFVNHDAQPNTMNHFNEQGEMTECTATVDIHPGEEILCDYRETCQTCMKDIGFEAYVKS